MRGQSDLGVTLPGPCLVFLSDGKIKRYIRKGLNQNNGADQQEVILADARGRVDPRTPLLWDYPEITKAEARPVDSRKLTVKGGTFVTIANQEKSEYRYHNRGFVVRRSNVVISGLRHEVTGELDHGNRYWGLFCSNYSKNLLFDGCEFSRFDAHMGVANATIRNSKLGYMGIHAIGFGTFLVEDTTVFDRSFFDLRSDYGSTWEGEFVVRRCRFVPADGEPVTGLLMSGQNDGQHDFGYVCHMPRKVVFDGHFIDDANAPKDYGGPFVFGDFNPARKDDAYTEKFPYVTTEEVVLGDVKTASGKPIRLCPNPRLFKATKIIKPTFY